MKKLIEIIFVSLLILLVTPTYVVAHPGRTDGSGSHTCRTNCPDWGYSYGEYHYHGGYTAPDPTPIITYKYEHESKDIPFKTSKVKDNNLLVGETYIKRNGVPGTKRITYKITYEDYVETGRTKDSEEVTKKPIDEIIAVGTQEPSTADTTQTDKGDIYGATDQKEESANAVIGLLLLSALIGGVVWYARRKSKTKDA